VRRGARVAIVAAVGVGLVAIAVAAVVLAKHDSEPPPVTPAEAHAAAVQTCADATTFEQLIQRNASIDDVKAVLRRAERESETAARGDAAWYALSGGIKSLRLSLDANDGRVARTGIDVVRAECSRLTP
jgi:hypothetical protein